MKSYEIHDKMKVIFTNNEKCAETCAVHKIKEDVMNVRFAYQVNAEFFKKKAWTGKQLYFSTWARWMGRRPY